MKRQHLLPLTNYLVNGQYAIVQPIASKFAERCIYYLLTTNCGREKAASASANKLSQQWAVRFSTAHRLEICRPLHLLPFDNKLCCEKAASASANKLSQQWAVRFSTAHRLEICRALHLLPFDNKLCCDKASSTSANELSRQWAVRFSTAHRLEIRRALHLIPSRNKMLSLKMLAHFRLCRKFRWAHI